MSAFAFDDYVRTTMSGATSADGSKLSSAQIERVANYLKSPGSGPDGIGSFLSYLNDHMVFQPPKLPQGMDYVMFSGTDGSGTSNFTNARTYTEQRPGQAGIIGDTPWGKFIESASKSHEFSTISGKFGRFLDSEGIVVFRNRPAGALEDMMWNAGSAPYMENAVNSGRPIVAFVENATLNRGFSNFELATAMKSPTTVVNGYPMSAFGSDPLAFASKSAAEYRGLEKALIQAATKNSHYPISLGEMRANVDVIGGYNAVQKTMFGQSLADFSKLNIDQMSAVSRAWTISHAVATIHPISEPRLGEASIRTTEFHDANGPPKDLVGEAESDIRIRPTEVTKDLTGGEVGAGSMARGALGMVGAAAVVHDGVNTASRATALLQQGNVTGAQSGLLHLSGRTLGMVAGGELVGGLGALAGAETGVGMFVTGAVGGIAGAIGGDKVADAIDNYRVHHQTDPQGLPWRYDSAHPERGWVSDLPPLPGAIERPIADAALQNRLDYQASGTIAELRIAHPGELPDPYKQPSGSGDPARLQANDWVRDTQTHAWTRMVVTDVVDRALLRTTETASPARAAELDKAAEHAIAQNRMNSPQGVAAAYQAMYEQRGWAALGAMPDVVSATLREADYTALASDGYTYTRETNGEWTRPGMLYGTNAAEGQVLNELNATMLASQRASGSDAAATAAASPPPVAHLERTPAAPHAEAARSVASMHGGDAAARHQAAKVLAEQARVEPVGNTHASGPSSDRAASSVARHAGSSSHASARAASHAQGADTIAQQPAQEQAARTAAHTQQAHRLAQEEQRRGAALAAQKDDQRTAGQEQVQREAKAQQETQAREADRREDRETHEQRHATEAREVEHRQTEDTHRVERQVEAKADSNPSHSMAEGAHAAHASVPLAASVAPAEKPFLPEHDAPQIGASRTTSALAEDAERHATVSPHDPAYSASHQQPMADAFDQHAMVDKDARPDALPRAMEHAPLSQPVSGLHEHVGKDRLPQHDAQHQAPVAHEPDHASEQVPLTETHAEVATAAQAVAHSVESGEPSASRRDMHEVEPGMPPQAAPQSAASDAHTAPSSTQTLPTPISSSPHVATESSSQSSGHLPIGNANDLIAMSGASQITVMGKGDAAHARHLHAADESGVLDKANPFGPGKAMEDRDIEELWFALQSKSPLAIDEACERLGQRPEAQALMKQADDYMFHNEMEQMKQQLAWASPESAPMIATQTPDIVKQDAPVLMMSLLNNAPGAPSFSASPGGDGGAGAGGGGGGSGGGGGGG